MNCPSCGAVNREGAAYCDSCGRPFAIRTDWEHAYAASAGPQKTLLESGGLTGWMAADWLIRFVLVAVLGLILGLFALGVGQYGFALFAFVLFVVGVVGTWFMLRAK